MKLPHSLLFWIFINLWGAIIPIIYFSAFLFKNTKIGDHGAKVWARLIMLVLKLLCGINYRVVGLENIPKEPCIIACQHQSMWETIVMHLIVNRPVYVYKKELEKIPFYGWFLKVMSGIAIDRRGGASALKDLIKQTKKYLAVGQSVIIFPQGTRVPVGASVTTYPYQPGIAAMYSSCKVKVVPAALNSGKFWQKNKILKKSGTIILEFLPPINPGLSKGEFMVELERVIEERSGGNLKKI